MFSGLRRALGSVSVKQKATEIVVEGIPADIMVRDISRIWKTSKITMNMFNTLGRNSFSFNTFFAPDVVTIIDRLIEEKGANTAVKALRNIRNEIIAGTYLRFRFPEFSEKEEQLPPERLDFSRLSQMKHEPFPYQMNYLKRYSVNVPRMGLNGYLLAAAPGAGKTLNTLQVSTCMNADLTVIVCPSNAVHRVWDKALREEAFKQPRPYWIFADGKPYNREKYVVCHYRALQHLLEMVTKGQIKGSNVCIILDESHNLNEANTLQTQLFIELCKKLRSENTIWASGTAIKAMGAELIPLLRTIDPMFTPDTEARFKKIYGKDASRALDILQHRLGQISFKVEKSELELAPPTFKKFPVKVPNGDQYTLAAIRKQMEAFIQERVKFYKDKRGTDETFWNQCLQQHKATLKTKVQWAEFEEYSRQLKTVIKIQDPRYCGEEIKFTNAYEKRVFAPSLPQEMRKQFQDVKSVIKYTQLKIQGECLGRVLGRSRIDCGVALTSQVDFATICRSAGKKTVVFTSFVEALRESEKVCKGQGLKPILVYGATNSELASNVARFEKDVDLNPLVATYQSLSTAVPLTMADTMLLLNSPFRDYILQQAVSRIHRVGQDSHVTIWQAELDTGDEPNISTRSNEILAWSQQQVEAITGVKSPFQVEEVAGLEDYVEAAQYDENATLHRLLNDRFEPFGIELSQEDFQLPWQRAVVSHTPAYAHW